MDDEICDLASALASTKYRQVKLADPMSGTNVARSRVRIETADTAGSIKLKIDLLNECAGSNCTSQLDLTHGGVSPLEYHSLLCQY